MLYSNITWLYMSSVIDKTSVNTLSKFITQNINQIDRYPGKFSENILTYTVKDISNRIALLKPKTNILTTAKTIYFSPVSKYPRFKFSTYSDIKKTIKQPNADVIVINSDNCDKSLSHYTNVLVITSASTNQTYAITLNAIIEMSYSYSKLQLMIRNINDEKELAEKFIALAVHEKLIPEDCLLTYFGNILEGNNKVCTFIGELFNSLTPVITDTELDIHINTKLLPLTAVEFSQIDKLLKSTDTKTVELGITMLSSFDVISLPCSVGILIINNINTISQCRCKTASFTQLLKTLDLENISSYNSEQAIDKLYAQSTDVEDRLMARNLIQSRIDSAMRDSFNSIKRKFTNMNFDIELTVK